MRRLARDRGSAVYLYATVQQWTWSRLALIAAARSVRLPVVMELNERPWSLADQRSRLERAIHLCTECRASSASPSTCSAGPRPRRPGPARSSDSSPSPSSWTWRSRSRPRTPTATRSSSSPPRPTIARPSSSSSPPWATCGGDTPSCRLQITGVNPDGERGRWLSERRSRGDLDARVELTGHDRAELLRSAMTGRTAC